MEEAKQWNMSPNEMQTTFYIVNVSPSVSIDEAVAVIIGILNNDIDELRKQTKVSLTDILSLYIYINLLNYVQISKNHFIFDNK